MREAEGGRSDMKDEVHTGRHPVVTCGDSVERTKAVVEEDTRRTCKETSEIVSMSSATVHRKLTNDLGKEKVFAKWVAHLLTSEQKQARVQAARHFLIRVGQEGLEFLSNIVTGDETWVYSYSFDPRSKRQSAQWLDSDESKPRKARRKHGERKMMHIFFDMSGIILSWLVPPVVTANGDYYRFVLKDRLRPAIGKKTRFA
ncbi:histone-lysine N-methyltransferase SETMAR-like [Aplysia californica]|uniref:Histone-lysine N-methyltransferase SETMAR-like n=1 Tax=Aplysia californica TaxID=6500 RepID=A0ABM0K830_APLCA|nr:histone-lysine N-methyltransferase SETMAR-like [Aplysia californica]